MALSTKLVTVVGATGAQGGSIVRTLLQNDEFTVRAVTRSKDSEAAQKLLAQGVEVVQADADDVASLEAAFEGSYAVFAMTNFFERLPEVGIEQAGRNEIRQGINLANAASKTPSLQHYLWSTLPNAMKVSGGKIFAPHFASKNAVDDYIKSDPVLLAKTTFLWPTFFASNIHQPFWKPFELPTAMAPNKYLVLMTIPPDVPIIMAGDIAANMGPFVLGILQQPEKTLGRFVLLGTETLTAGAYFNTWAAVQGKELEYVTIDKGAHARCWPIWSDTICPNYELLEMLGEQAFSGEDLLTNDDLGIQGLVSTEEYMRSLVR